MTAGYSRQEERQEVRQDQGDGPVSQQFVCGKVNLFFIHIFLGHFCLYNAVYLLLTGRERGEREGEREGEEEGKTCS